MGGVAVRWLVGYVQLLFMCRSAVGTSEDQATAAAALLAVITSVCELSGQWLVLQVPLSGTAGDQQNQSTQ
jgi:hypothetical protein